MVNLLSGLMADFGVRARLLSAFGLMVLLTAAVGTIGWKGFSDSQQAMDSLQQDSLPQLYQSMQLAGQSNALLLQAQAVVNAKLLFQVDAESAELRRRLTTFLELVHGLPEANQSPGSDSLADLAERLEAVFLELIDLSRSRVFLVSGVQELQFRLDSRHREAVEGLESLLAAADLPLQVALARVLGQVQRLEGILRAAATTLDNDELLILDKRFRDTRTELLARLETLPPSVRVDDTDALAGRLLDLGQGEDGLFARRRAQFANLDRRSYLLTLGGIHATDLIQRLADNGTATAEQARERSLVATSALDNGKFRILLLAGVSLAAALLSALYVVRDLGGNLRGVTEAMGQLAAGNREVTVPATERRDEIGVLARTFNVFKDNTFKLDLASRELQEKSRLLQAIFDNMKDGLTVFDDQGRLLAWNDQFLALYDLQVGQMQGGTTLEAIHEQLARRHATLQSLDGQRIDPREINPRRQRAPQQFEQHLDQGRILELRSNPMPGGGFVTIYTDITERTAIEAQLRQAQKMETVGQLTGGIAHDFNNLLAVIVGNLDSLQERLAGQERLQVRARRALDAADRAATLIQRLLAFSRKQALQPRRLAVNELVEGMLDLLGYSVGDRVALEAELAPDLWPTVIDPGQLENALMNLVVNARDAMPTGGRLDIRTANRYLVAGELGPPFPVPTGRYVTLAVRDQGSGMTPEILARVLEPFYTTKEAGAGSGLGLSMIYGFVAQSGGHLHIDSRPGGGTTVTLFLPPAPEGDESAPVAAREVSPAGSGERVLVLDDDPGVRQVVVDMLQEQGYRTLEAGDGRQALDLLEGGEAVDLLLTDVVLPGGLNGPEVARQARQRRPGLRVLYTSGYSQDALLRHGRLPEDVELIAKPYDRYSLGLRVRRVLDAGG